jgi:hypothetical protein
MNSDKEKTLFELAQRNPYWVCIIVFLALAADQGFRLATQLDQRHQLTEAEKMQTQNMGVLYEAQKLEVRLQNLSLDLLQMASTNSRAKQIVQDFNIQWNPGTAQPAATAPAQPPAQPAPAGAPPLSNASAPK